MNLTQLHEEWALDANIDLMSLDKTARNTPLLHAKY
jgi:hypothetical protein